MGVEFDLLLNIRLAWIFGIGEIRFWEKRIDDRLTAIDDLMTPGGVPKGGVVDQPGTGDFYISSTLRVLCVEIQPKLTVSAISCPWRYRYATKNVLIEENMRSIAETSNSV